MVSQKSRLSFCWFMLLLLSLYSLALAQAGNPKVIFKEQQWNFGQIKQGEVVSHEFIFKNEGTTPLKVNRVSTSCGCTAALVSEKEIAPGKEGRLKVTFDSHGYAGKVIKYIYFESNDPRTPQVELSIVVEVEVGPSPRIELDRYNLDLGICLEGEESSTRLKVKNSGQLELTINIENPDYVFYAAGKNISFPYRIAAGKEVELELRLPGKEGRVGLLRDYVLIKCNDPSRPTLSLFITRYVITRQELKKLFEKYGQLLGIK
ncbi:MAG: DUF1573 domain-containing protein [Candidatus Saccharicenans sp.]